MSEGPFSRNMAHSILMPFETKCQKNNTIIEAELAVISCEMDTSVDSVYHMTVELIYTRKYNVLMDGIVTSRSISQVLCHVIPSLPHDFSHI